MEPPLALDALRRGGAIPAHPLALTSSGRLDERRQRALTRYYLDAGAAGVAVGVHTTQFAIHDNGMLRDVLAISAEVAAAEYPGALLVAGVQGPVTAAVAEAELAATLGYDFVLVRPERDLSELELVHRSAAIGEVVPTLGFYLQPTVGGRVLSRDYWCQLAELESLVGVKVAAFDHYRTLDVVFGLCRAGRGGDVALYTGNDNSIAFDLVAPHRLMVNGAEHRLEFVGGLLGQWALWTRAAVAMCHDARLARAGDDAALRRVLSTATALTAANAAVFDVANKFRGCISGIHEVLRRQGLLATTRCLDPAERLSDGQAAAIDHALRAAPSLAEQDDAFVAENLSRWLR